MPYESTISDLKAAISRLETEKRHIDEQLLALSSSLRYFEALETGGEQPVPKQSNSTQVHSDSSGRAQYQGTDNNLRDAMAEILAAEGPLHRREIYDRLMRLGVPIGGQDPINNVGAHLSIDSRFENVGRGMWQLSEPGDEADIGENDSNEEEGDVPW